MPCYSYLSLRQASLSACLALILAACGGGGGGTSGGTGGTPASSTPGSSASSVVSASTSSMSSNTASATTSLSSSSSSQSTSSAGSLASSSKTSSSMASSSAASATVSSSSSSTSSSSPSSSSSASAGSNPITLTSGFYVDPNSQAKAWVASNVSDSRMVTIRDGIANQAFARWFGGWNGDIGSAVSSYVSAAATVSRLPLLVAYNIPNRDCGSYSAGGASGGDAYKTWIAAFASAIGTKPAIVILEPDALMQLDCLPSDADRSARLVLLNYAVDQFSTKAPNTWLYIDAGHSAWKSASDTATRLINAGVQRAHGFALNVSNYRSTAELTSHGQAVAAQLQSQAGFSKPFVLDTSRNGNGPKGSEWCDPSGRKIGAVSQFHTLGGQPEMSLWLKAPGEADGCAAGAGQFLPDLAYKLVLGL